MIRSSRTGASLLVGIVVGSLALTGCGAGQVAGTAIQVSATDGTNTAYGPIVVRNAVITFPEDAPEDEGAIYARGGSAPLDLTIVNQVTEADRLVSATSPVAGTVAITGRTEIPAGRTLVVSGEAEPAGALPAAPATGVDAEEGAQIVLTGLREEIVAGETYEVVLTFENAGEVVVDTAVGPTDEERPAAEGEH